MILSRIRYSAELKWKLVKYYEKNKDNDDFYWFKLISEINDIYKLEEINSIDYDTIYNRIWDFDSAVIENEVHIIKFYCNI